MARIPVSRRYPFMTLAPLDRVLWGRAIGSEWGAGGDPMALAARWRLKLANAGSMRSRPEKSGALGVANRVAAGTPSISGGDGYAR
jgi:hypothetical protein